MMKIARILEATRYFATSRRSLEYIGILGIRNLGDEALFDLIRGSFRPIPIVHCRHPHRPRWLKEAFDRKARAGVILGGGTLIGRGSADSNVTLDTFERAVRSHDRSFGFGTGVSGIDFDAADAHTASIRRRWIEALSGVDFIGVRGPDSAATLRGWGLDCEIIGDPGCLAVQPEGYWQPQPLTLGVNIGRSRTEFPALYRAVADCLRRLVSEGWRAEFFVVWPEDLKVTIQTAKLAGIGRPTIHEEYFNVSNYLNQVRNMSVFLGLKLHSVIFAMCAGTPAIMLEYKPKCLDFMKSVGMERFDLPLHSANSKVLVDTIHQVSGEAAELSSATLKRIHRFKTCQTETARTLAASL